MRLPRSWRSTRRPLCERCDEKGSTPAQTLNKPCDSGPPSTGEPPCTFSTPLPIRGPICRAQAFPVQTVHPLHHSNRLSGFSSREIQWSLASVHTLRRWQRCNPFVANVLTAKPSGRGTPAAGSRTIALPLTTPCARRIMVGQSGHRAYRVPRIELGLRS